MYGKINITDATLIALEDVPGWTYGIGLTDDQLADLGSFGLYGIGYWPVNTVIPFYNPETHRIGALMLGEPDRETRTIPATYAVHKIPPPAVPETQTLGDWRVAMVLWRTSAGTSRLDDLLARVENLSRAGLPVAAIVKERIEYSNEVFRTTLISVKDAFGFTVEDIDESMWRAERVRLGDLSGVWPLVAPMPDEPDQPTDTDQPAEPEDEPVEVAEPAEPEEAAA